MNITTKQSPFQIRVILTNPTGPLVVYLLLVYGKEKKKLVNLIKALTDNYNSASIKKIITFSNIKPAQSHYLITPISEDLTGTKSIIFK